MVASRILTPLFGSGIYTWATIISIVVGGLMAGYFLGGYLADRFPASASPRRSSSSPRPYLFFVYFMAQGGLEGIIAGIDNEYAALFVSGFVVCFPPLVVLGMYSPLSVRLLLSCRATPARSAAACSPSPPSATSSASSSPRSSSSRRFGTRTITAGFATFLLASGFFSLVVRAIRRGDGEPST